MCVCACVCVCVCVYVWWGRAVLFCSVLRIKPRALALHETLTKTKQKQFRHKWPLASSNKVHSASSYKVNFNPVKPSGTGGMAQALEHLPSKPWVQTPILQNKKPNHNKKTLSVLRYMTLMLSEETLLYSYIFINLFIFGFLRQDRVSQAGLKFLILLPQPPECWDYRCLPPQPASFSYDCRTTKSYECNSNCLY
jgi:hypothetical protein